MKIRKKESRFSEKAEFCSANVQFFKDLTAGFADAISDGVERTKALDPPSELESVHDALIEAGEEATVSSHRRV